MNLKAGSSFRMAQKTIVTEKGDCANFKREPWLSTLCFHYV